MACNRFDSKIVYPYIKGKCRFCKGDLPKRRRTFCSDVCVKIFLDKTDWGKIRKRVFKRDGGVCKICGCELNERARNGYHVDHICPISKGGNLYDMDNLQLTCSVCNLKKGAKLEE